MEGIQELQEELEKAAAIVMAPPNIVNNEQRQNAEKLFIDFQCTTMPYEMCCTLLQKSTNEFVLFEAATLIKSALIKEWLNLLPENIISLRQFLIQYLITRPGTVPFVRERIIQIIAVIVKLGNINTPGTDRRQILEELQSIVVNGDSYKQILACNIILAILQEYATRSNSTDARLTGEVHIQAKKQFQSTDLKKILLFSYEALKAMTRENVQEMQIPLIKYLLQISEYVLSWPFSLSASKFFDDAFEAMIASQNFPYLRLDESWKDLTEDPALINFYFNIYWKVRNTEAAEHGLRCLVQFGCIKGILGENDQQRLTYIRNYLHNFLQLLSLLTVSEHESIAVATMFQRPFVNAKPQTYSFLADEGILTTYLEQITRQTCFFAQSVAPMMFDEDCKYTKAFDYILRAWYQVFAMKSFVPEEFYKQIMIQVFNVYVQCHLSAPDGIRGVDDVNENIDANEEDDRTKFLQQLQTIGSIGRQALEHTLPLMARLLEDRTVKLREELNRLASESSNLSNSKPPTLDNLYEDLHWLVLVAGHVLCMESIGEEPLIPSEIMNYCLKQLHDGKVDVNVSMQLLASPQSNISDIAEAEQKADHVIRLIASVFRLCEIEKIAIHANLAYMLSPELSGSIVWFLGKWSSMYLMPKEANYDVISITLSQAFGIDSQGAMWVIDFLLEKIQTNIVTFQSELSLIKETLDLLMVLVTAKEKNSYIIKSDRLGGIIELTLKNSNDYTPSTKRSLMRVAIKIGLAYPNKEDRQRYWEMLLGPLRNNFNQIVGNENFKQIYDQESVRLQISNIYESLIGIFDDVISSMCISSVEIFPYFIDLLEEIPRILSLYHNYQQLVHLVLEVFYECTREMFYFLNQEQSIKIYNLCMSIMETYSRLWTIRMTSDSTAEEDAYQDILLFMKILTQLSKKTLYDFSVSDSIEPNAASVFLYGLYIIMPMMNSDLMAFPTLCDQYFSMLNSFCVVYPEKVVQMHPKFLEQVLMSISTGLYAFSNEVSMLCCDFIYVLARHIYKENKTTDKPRNEMLAAFLPLMFEMILEWQVNMDLVPHMGMPIFCLICCYPDKYEEIAQKLIEAHPNHANRLRAAFSELISKVRMDTEKSSGMKFESSFEKFIANLKSFLIVKRPYAKNDLYKKM